jgi:hypothetical protein
VGFDNAGNITLSAKNSNVARKLAQLLGKDALQNILEGNLRPILHRLAAKNFIAVVVSYHQKTKDQGDFDKP